MFVCQCFAARCQSSCQLRRLLGEQTWCNCFVDISTQMESVAAGTVDKEPLTHDHPSSASQRKSFASSSGARNGKSPAASQCALYCRCWARNAGPGRLCLYLSLTALPVVGRAAETLTCLCHAGIRFLRPHLPPCCFCKHFQVPSPVRRTDKHVGFKARKRTVKLVGFV